MLEDDRKEICPLPPAIRTKPLHALIFDSQYDSYKGVIVYFRVMDGVISQGMDREDDVRLARVYKVVEVGYLRIPRAWNPAMRWAQARLAISPPPLRPLPTPGWATPSPGRTILRRNPCPGYKEVQPMVFSGVYPADGAKYPELRDALEKLKLNDASLSFEPETSVALGFGFRCGFLGLLHMEIIQERLEREFNLDLITTAPSVVYRVTKTDGSVSMIDNPTELPRSHGD